MDLVLTPMTGWAGSESADEYGWIVAAIVEGDVEDEIVSAARGNDEVELVWVGGGACGDQLHASVVVGSRRGHVPQSRQVVGAVSEVTTDPRLDAVVGAVPDDHRELDHRNTESAPGPDITDLDVDAVAVGI